MTRGKAERAIPLSEVMPGLVPGTYALLAASKKDMGDRDTPGTKCPGATMTLKMAQHDRNPLQSIVMSAALMGRSIFRFRSVVQVRDPPTCRAREGQARRVPSAPCPAVINAIADALWRACRIRHVDMPATPERLSAAIAEGRRVHTL
jgi:hypothetical protein